MNFVVFSNALLLVAMGAVMALVGVLFPATEEPFVTAGGLAALVGALAMLAVVHRLRDFRHLHGFLLTATIWITGATAGALPLWLWQLSAVDAFFESLSGITTTGSTVMTGLDFAPRGILLWRAILQAIGGIGFVVTGIAFLPMLRVGGMQLFRTESSEGGDKELASAARFAGATVWIYLGLIGLCAMTYSIGGMTAFEAICHAMATVSTGGYSTSDASFGHFQSPFLQWAGTLFMLSGAIPFAWYIRALTRGDLSNEQVRAMLIFLATVIAVLAAWRVLRAHAGLHEALLQSAFSVVSVVTTTGFATVDYTTWGPFAAGAFFILTAVGGCTGSTAGGAKTMRWIIFLRVLRTRIRAIYAPHSALPPTYKGRRIEDDVMNGVITYFTFYALTVALLASALAMFELDPSTALSGALTAVANVGPGVGEVIGPSGNFAGLPDGAKLLLCFGMYVGRLEMMTVFVLLTRAYWREIA